MKKLIFPLMIIFFSSSLYAQNLTLSQIRTSVRLKIKDNVTNAAQRSYDDNQLNLKINSMQDEIVSFTRCLSSTCYIATSTGTREYSLPTGFFGALRVSYAYNTSSTNVSTSSYVKLEQVDKATLDRSSSTWETAGSSSPKRYYLNQTYIGIDPKPYVAGFNYLKIECYIQATTLSSDSDIPFNSVSYLYPYHQAIVYAVAMECAEEMGLNDKFAEYQGKYTDYLKALVNNLSQKTEWTPIFPTGK